MSRDCFAVEKGDVVGQWVGSSTLRSRCQMQALINCLHTSFTTGLPCDLAFAPCLLTHCHILRPSSCSLAPSEAPSGHPQAGGQPSDPYQQHKHQCSGQSQQMPHPHTWRRSMSLKRTKSPSQSTSTKNHSKPTNSTHHPTPSMSQRRSSSRCTTTW